MKYCNNVTHYVDIEAMLADNFHLGEERYRTAITQQKYDHLGEHIFVALRDLVSNKDDLSELIELCFPQLYSNLCIYLSFLLDLSAGAHSKRISFSSRASHTFNVINSRRRIEDTPLNNIAGSRWVPNWKLNSYHRVVPWLPSKLYSRLVLQKNTLALDFLEGRGAVRFSLEHYLYVNGAAGGREIAVDTTSCRYILNSLVLDSIAGIREVLDDLHTSNLLDIIRMDLGSIMYLKKFVENDRFLSNVSGKQIITGTGSKSSTRVLSKFFKINGNEVLRFSHGGDRCFFNDEVFRKTEFFECDKYITHGHAEGRFLFDRSIGMSSKYHKRLYESFSNTSNTGNQSHRTVVYCSGSYVGDLRHFYNMKYVDTLYFDWQLYLVKMLKRICSSSVLYKKHPKGFLHAENVVGEFADGELNMPMEEALAYGDIWIFDMAGSAFVEALCAGKQVIYIDSGQRKFNPDTFTQLNSSISIIKTVEGNSCLSVDESHLKELIYSDRVNKSEQESLVNEFYLSRTRI